MAKQLPDKDNADAYKQRRKWRLGSAAGISVILICAIGFMTANDEAANYTKRYQAWQKNTAAKFVAQTSPEIQQTFFPTKISSKQVIDSQKKACNGFRAAVTAIDKRLDQPPKIRYAVLGFLSPAYNKARSKANDRQKLLDDYLRTARRVYNQAHVDCEFSYESGVFYYELKPKRDEANALAMREGESENGITCNMKKCLPTTMEKIAAYRTAYLQSYVAMLEKSLPYWRSQACQATSYRQMCGKKAELTQIRLEMSREYTEALKSMTTPTDTRIRQMHDQSGAKGDRAEKVYLDAFTAAYGKTYQAEIEREETSAEAVMSHEAREGFKTARAKAAAFTER